MNKDQIIAVLTALGIAHDPNLSKAELEALLPADWAVQMGQVNSGQGSEDNKPDGFTTLDVRISKIRYIGSRQLFLINDTYWLSARDMQRIFADLGLSSRTNFLKIRGTILTCLVVEVAAGETITDPVTGRDITFRTEGVKHLNWEVKTLNKQLEDQIMASGLETLDWGAIPDMPAEA